MQYFLVITIAAMCFSGYFSGVEAAVGISCPCAGGNHEVCDPDGTGFCVCDDSNGYVDDKTGTCQLRDCGSLPAPSHGSVDTSAGTNVGDQARFSCDPAYTPDSAVCKTDGLWSKDGTSYICTIVDCTMPTVPGDGRIVLVGGVGTTKYQDTGTVTCDAGFGLSTNEASTTITCQADGRWTAIPTCSVGAAADCGDPAAPTNGATSFTATTERHEATVDCDSGYTLDGTATITCQHDDTWSAAGTCKSDGAGSNGAGSVTAGLIFTLAYTVISRLF